MAAVTTWARGLAGGLAALMLASCAVVEEQDRAPRSPPPDLASVPDAVPRAEPPSRYGNPDSYVVLGRRYHVMDSAAGYRERGIASWYGEKFHGRRTSNQEVYDMYAMTAAHKSLPLPTYVEVTNLDNGRSAVVRVNDRGPFHANRIIDLSFAAATRLGMVRSGTAPVEVRALSPRDGAPRERVAAPAAAPGAGMYLQVGAFSRRDNAVRLQSRLRSLTSVAVRITPGGGGALPVHRVRLGPLPSVEALDRLAERLAARGIQDAHVVLE